jgi:diguanylate cyclase (GGDEF)-like protein
VSISVMLVDTEADHRAQLAGAFRAAGFSVTSEVGSCAEALEALGGLHHPDVAVVDVAALGHGGASVAREMRSRARNGMHLVAMADPRQPERVAELVAAGARAYVVKTKVVEIEAAVRAVAAGSGLLSAEVTRPVLDEVARLYDKERGRNEELEELVRQLQALSVTDWLTGLKNHGYFFERLSDELDRGLRHRRPLAVVICDIDDFKQINDTRGHAAGDRVLQEVSAVMAETIRSADIVCRVGGEEFGILLPETDSAGAHLVAERVREQVGALSISGVGRVTISLGVASVPEHAVDRDELMEAADRALYLAKREGKNRTRIAGDLVTLGTASAAAKSNRNQVVDLLVRVLRLRDTALADHAGRTAEVAVALGAQSSLSTAQLEHLRIAALLQDVGKIGIPDRILYKRGPLTDEEWEVVREHPKKGFELIGGLVHPEAGEAVLANHERYDGKGYPRGLRGEEIPLLGRILLVADAFVAMTMERPFQAAVSVAAAVEELAANAGTQFDPDVVGYMADLAAAMAPEPPALGDVVQMPVRRAGSA